MDKINAKYNQITCNGCGRELKNPKVYQLYCSTDCENKKKEILEKLNKEIYERKCIYCNLTFRKTRTRSTQEVCYSCKRANDKVYNKTNRKPKKKSEKKKTHISYEELNRRAEYKRVFDDSGWTHFLKGRIWDRI